MEPGARVELDLPVRQRGVEVEQHDEAVVDAGPPDAPFIHQRRRVRLGLIGRDVVAAERLRVDHDLRLGLGLDRIDDRLGLPLGPRRQDTRVVVDGLAVDGLRERRTGRRGETGAEVTVEEAPGDGEAATTGPAASANSHRTAATTRTVRCRCMRLIVPYRSVFLRAVPA